MHSCSDQPNEGLFLVGAALVNVIHHNAAVIHTVLIVFASREALQNQMRGDEVKIRASVMCRRVCAKYRHREQAGRPRLQMPVLTR